MWRSLALRDWPSSWPLAPPRNLCGRRPGQPRASRFAAAVGVVKDYYVAVGFDDSFVLGAARRAGPDRHGTAPVTIEAKVLTKQDGPLRPSAIRTSPCTRAW